MFRAGFSASFSNTALNGSSHQSTMTLGGVQRFFDD